MLVSLYARVSTQRQESEETIGNQLMAIKEFADKNGHTIIKEYLDDGWSGTILARPGLDELRMDATKKAWQGVIIYDPDRLARKYSYQALLIDELEELGTKLLFVTTPPAKTQEDKLLYGVKGLFAEYERAKIAERFRLGKIRKARDGNVVTSHASYGYDYIPKQGSKQGYFVINPAEAEVVRMIFEWVGIERLSIRKIINRLKELGIKPRKSKRGVWNTSTIGRMLRNRTYIGIAHYNRTYAVLPTKPLKQKKYKKVKKTSRKIRSRDEWIDIEGITPIVDKKLFDLVQKQLRLNYQRSRRNRKNDYLLSGVIRCVCGKTRVGEGPQQGKHLYYRCADRVAKYPLERTCFEKGINARIADRMVWEKLSKLMSSPDLIRKQAERYIKKKGKQVESGESRLENLEIELNKLRNEEKRYIKAFGHEIITQSQLEDAMKDLQEKKKVVESHIGNITSKRESHDVVAPPDRAIVDFCDNYDYIMSKLPFEKKRKITLEVVDKIISDQKQMQVFGHLPITKKVGLYAESRNSGFT